MRALARLTCWVACTALLLASCELNPLSPGVAVSREEKAISLLVYSCPGERPLTVRVVQTDDESVGGTDDRILWEVRSDVPPQLLVARYGEVPSGFVKVTTAAPLPPSQVAVVADWGDLQHALLFRVDDVPQGALLADKGQVSHMEFEDGARAIC